MHQSEFKGRLTRIACNILSSPSFHELSNKPIYSISSNSSGGISQLSNLTGIANILPGGKLLNISSANLNSFCIYPIFFTDFDRLTENDITTADRVYRLAFGTFVGLHATNTIFRRCRSYRARFRANPSAALAAEVNGVLVGSNFMAD